MDGLHGREGEGSRYRVGSGASGWTVGAQTVSAVRTPPPPRAIRISARPLPVEIDLARTALLVVDMQNDFVHPDGWFAAKGIDIAPLADPVVRILRLCEACRSEAVPVVWLNWGIRSDAANLPANTLYRGKRTADAPGYGEAHGDGADGALVEGSWGAATADALRASPDDLTVSKHRFSGFPDSVLESVLRARGVTTLLFAGVNIDRCVFATLTDASARGFDCVLVEDACATVSPPEIAQAVVWLVAELHGFVSKTGDILGAIASRQTSPRVA